MNKKELRKELLKKRNNIKSYLKQEQDNIIYENFINSELYKNAQDIFIYVSFGSEVDTHKIINRALKDKKNVYVPKTDMNKKEMIAVKIHSLSELNVDSYGILAPVNVDKTLIANKFDIIVMPGVAFDKLGNRIGYGGGYYDKYIKNNIRATKKIALAYEEQIIERIESEIHDIKVDYIISPKKFSNLLQINYKNV